MADTAGTLTIGSSTTFFGFLAGSFGAITDTDFNGTPINVIFEDDAGVDAFLRLTTNSDAGSSKLFESVTVDGVTIPFEDFDSSQYIAPNMQWSKTTGNWSMPTSGTVAYKVSEVPTAKPIVVSPSTNLMNISGDVVYVDFRAFLSGETSISVAWSPAIPNGLTETNGLVTGTVTTPTGTSIATITATNSFGSIVTKLQWTTLTTGDPTSGINASPV